ncbi:Sodium/calcium exchanger protein-domain-containing protein [Suillus bovinus]|uniref:Sodium/calcium exchanger protein-domain-containing protein n=1 Tax=Suillus bovinus TaxID=48563 RepID=UPI001B878DED|nr:Sodium/calcium exchanger protein-domain-containing protein [Suillus bovinus]KAG2152988.1 Sodium/calcium exchanger protein-domain-containing protein [Suillus bovinus]
MDDHSNQELSTTPTPTSHLHLHRSRSHSSHWSPVETPTHHHAGTSYCPSSSPTPRASYPQPSISHSLSNSRTRSTSTNSSHRPRHPIRDNDGMLSQDEEVSYEDHVNDRGVGGSRDRGKGIQDQEGELEEGDSEERETGSEHDDSNSRDDDDPITVKDRQSLINVEHPFGLPIWKPALYKKSRSVTRHADAALHSVPSAQAERHLLPGNIFWVICFGWWLALACFAVSAMLCLVPLGGKRYAVLMFGLGWYLAWPFGKYVKGDAQGNDEESTLPPEDLGSASTVDANPSLSRTPTITPNTTSERTFLRPPAPSKSYGAAPSPTDRTPYEKISADWLGRAIFWILFITLVAPLLLLTCIACWALIITVPMAKLNWALIKYIFASPTRIRFCAAPLVPPSAVKTPRLAAGQAVPSTSGHKSTVLLCVYRAVGWQYYKYTVGGVNIIFVNLLPLVFFVILDGFVLMPMAEDLEDAGEHVPRILALVASKALIFLMSLASVIPLSYFIGMAVASISAQSSIGMGAVINATFGSVVEVVLYSIALTQGKGRLVEGSIVGSLLAGVLLMPGMSMCAGALRKKEMKFNAKSAGVTSMMLIMAFIGTLTPTLFYQTYGSFQLICSGCPDGSHRSSEWKCDQCYYQHPDPVEDPFYQSTVKSLMYFCAVILLFSYLIGLWFSLRTHATQIWQNPQPLLQPLDIPTTHPSRLSLYQHHRPHSNATTVSTAQSPPSQIPPIIREPRLRPEGSHERTRLEDDPRFQTPAPRLTVPTANTASPTSSSLLRRVSYVPHTTPQSAQSQTQYTPLLESVDHAIKSTGALPLPSTMSTDDFTRAVAVATVSALRHQHAHTRAARASVAEEEHASAHGHEAPEWSRITSAAVLLSCTALYALIAELLVDMVDVVLKDSGIEEKFLGITLFALVPNTTEFMNAISFALNGNISLSVEIGSAYALQVCLLQIPAMVAFSAWYAPDKMGEIANAFTLVFPRWDVIAIILSVFLMTYTYIEAKSNYHRGSILILSYVVLVSGFYFAPRNSNDHEDVVVAGHVEALSVVSQLYAALWS